MGGASQSASSKYAEAYDRACTDPVGFWAEAADAISWVKKPSVILDDSEQPLFRWFSDGILNVCYNALDRHVIEGRADHDALIYDSAVTGAKKTYTYAQLVDLTARFAGVLRHLGVQKGDRVVIYMPMIPEAVIAMLACARIGAVHSVVFGGFAPNELAARIDDAKPVVVVSASCGIEPRRVVEYKPLLDQALEVAEHQVGSCVIVQRDEALATMVEGRDVEWSVMMRPGVASPAECVTVAATDPLYILYTSGTTGKPKGVVRDSGGYAVAMAWSMRNIYDVGVGDTMLSASDVGWVVGHSYIVYGPLIAGAATVLYEGKPVGTPDAGALWRLVDDHKVKTLFTAPTSIRAVKREDPHAREVDKYDISSLTYLFLAGERLDPDTYDWAQRALGVPVIDNWWQTETGWPIAANPMGLEQLPVKAGSPTVPIPGYQVKVVDATGDEVPANTDGAIVVKLPLPPGTFPALWQDNERYIREYLSVVDGYYLTGDGGHLDDDGYVFVMGRTDDVINVAGHRLSTGTLEAAIAGHPDVAECAVIAVHDDLKGSVPRALVVLKADAHATHEQVAAQCVQRVRDEVGAVAALRQVDVVPALPKTRSGKILRKIMREMADGKIPTVPSTIDDRSVLDALGPVLSDNR